VWRREERWTTPGSKTRMECPFVQPINILFMIVRGHKKADISTFLILAFHSPARLCCLLRIRALVPGPGVDGVMGYKVGLG
jgi:hypothetical protein